MIALCNRIFSKAVPYHLGTITPNFAVFTRCIYWKSVLTQFLYCQILILPAKMQICGKCLLYIWLLWKDEQNTEYWQRNYCDKNKLSVQIADIITCFGGNYPIIYSKGVWGTVMKSHCSLSQHLYYKYTLYEEYVWKCDGWFNTRKPRVIGVTMQ